MNFDWAPYKEGFCFHHYMLCCQIQTVHSDLKEIDYSLKQVNSDVIDFNTEVKSNYLFLATLHFSSLLYCILVFTYNTNK